MTGMLANVSAARGWSIFTPMISSIAGMLDHLGPLGFIRRKNMDLGWGDDLAAVLERDYAESCQSIIEKHAPAIEWKDSWRQERSERQAGKFSFLELFKRSTYGGNEKIMYETLLVRDGFFISPYADILPDGAKEAHFRCIIPLKPGMELPSKCWIVLCIKYPSLHHIFHGSPENDDYFGLDGIERIHRVPACAILTLFIFQAIMMALAWVV